MDNPQPSFRSILYRTIISHTATYFATGVIAAILLGYTTRMIRPDVAPIIRDITDPILIARPLFQPFRAALLAIVFYLLRDVLYGYHPSGTGRFLRSDGWAVRLERASYSLGGECHVGAGCRAGLSSCEYIPA